MLCLQLFFLQMLEGSISAEVMTVILEAMSQSLGGERGLIGNNRFFVGSWSRRFDRVRMGASFDQFYALFWRGIAING